MEHTELQQWIEANMCDGLELWAGDVVLGLLAHVPQPELEAAKATILAKHNAD